MLQTMKSPKIPKNYNQKTNVRAKMQTKPALKRWDISRKKKKNRICSLDIMETSASQNLLHSTHFFPVFHFLQHQTKMLKNHNTFSIY